MHVSGSPDVAVDHREEIYTIYTGKQVRSEHEIQGEIGAHQQMVKVNGNGLWFASNLQWKTGAATSER